MIFQIIKWNPDPEMFSLGPLAVRWYGVLFASGFFFGYLIMRRFFKNEGISDEFLDRLTIYMAVGTIVGARLGHCLFYEPEHYLSQPIDLIKIWEGGLASHGAAIAIMLAIWLFTQIEKKPYFWASDRIAVVVALAGVLIRLGNLMNSEIYGIQTAVSWGFVFLLKGESVPKHPTQLYEALAYLFIFILLLRIYWRKKGDFIQGVPTALFFILIFTARFFIEYVKEDQVPFEALMRLNMGQLLSIPLVLGGIALLIFSVKKGVRSYVATETVNPGGKTPQPKKGR